MSKFRLACHLIQFGGEQRDNPEKVLREVAVSTAAPSRSRTG